jgi:DMSO/TMAO reductase YedYZ molybdopterin-dependent catalytic subunit
MLHRRHFLQAAGLSAVPLAARRTFAAEPAPAAPFPGMVVRAQEPQNLEFPFATLDSFLTPTERFYVRCHFAVPTINAANWRLRVEGAVERPLELSLEDVRKLPSHTQAATLECAGNGRVFLVPRAKGTAWQLGAVSNAEWTGVPLAAVLDKAGVKSSAVEVILEGADTGAVNDDPKTPGVISYARSLPLAKARSPEVLLAHKMNGADLTASHGFPLRAVVGGWFGMASVKWLTKVIVTDRPFQGYWQTMDYTVYERRGGLPTLVPLAEMLVKASIARPSLGDVVPAGRPARVFGAAWGGMSPVERVEVSADGGQTWGVARLLDKPVPFAWRLWEHEWRPERPGRYALVAKATDAAGHTQPTKRDPDRQNYAINHLVPVMVEAR